MTFPRRGTRRLSVGGVEYLWHVSERHNFGDVASLRAVDGGPTVHYWPKEGWPSPAEAAEVVLFVTARRDLSNQETRPIWVDRRESGLALSEERPISPWERKRPKP